MIDAALITDADFARARRDPVYRHQLLAGSLELLLNELNRLHRADADAERARQIREGVGLALQLAELLQRLDLASSGTYQAA